MKDLVSSNCDAATIKLPCQKDWFLELIIVASISGGANAVKAIKGAVVKACSPPRFENDFLKSLPLEENQLQEYTS